MKKILSEILQFILIAVFIVLPIRLFIAQPFVVSGQSMYPTFHDGDYLIVDQITYYLEDPERGSVAIFKYPYDTSKYFIKRIIGLPGETVVITNGVVTILNEEHPDGFTLDNSFVTEPQVDNLSTTLEEDEYFVMGDNRANSSDSRVWGALKKEYIVGRPFVRLLPVPDADMFPGYYSLTE